MQNSVLFDLLIWCGTVIIRHKYPGYTVGLPELRRELHGDTVQQKRETIGVKREIKDQGPTEQGSTNINEQEAQEA